MSDIELQWNQWLEKTKNDVVPDVTDEELKTLLIQDLSFVSQMEVSEYILFQKWCELKEKYPTKEYKTLFGKQIQMVNKDDQRLIKEIKQNIWLPESLDDYKKLQPELIYTGNSDLSVTWNCIRDFISTMKNNSNIGRNLNYLVRDKVTKKYLGVICISSDFLDLTPRDKFIGWDRKFKTQGNRINFTAIGSTIVPFQPLGYNYVGGKLLALLCLSDEVQNRWKSLYGDVLVGVTTTSLFGKTKQGGLSQYDGLKYWKKMGFSSGSVSYESTKPTIAKMLAWLRKNYPRKYFEWYVAVKPSGQPYKRDHRNRSYTFIYSKLGIPKNLVKSEHQRGIYFSPLYTNTQEFLRGEIQENQLVKAFDASYESLANIWKEKYACKRIRNLIDSNRVSSETLFYDDAIFLDWNQTKSKYIQEVGR